MTQRGERLADFAFRLGLKLPGDAQEALPLPLCGLHRAVLGVFPDTGTAPSEAWLRNQALDLDLDRDAALARLSHDDLVPTADGIVTAHRVMPAAISGGCSTAAEASCPFVNFHTSAGRAGAHLIVPSIRNADDQLGAVPEGGRNLMRRN